MTRKTPTQLRKQARTAVAPSPVEPLEGRTLFSVHAVFLEGPGRLTVFGGNQRNNITVGRNTKKPRVKRAPD